MVSKTMQYLSILSKSDILTIQVKASLRALALKLEELLTFNPHILYHQHIKIKDRLPKDLSDVLITLGDNYHPVQRLENHVKAYERHELEETEAFTYFCLVEAYKTIYKKVTPWRKK